MIYAIQHCIGVAALSLLAALAVFAIARTAGGIALGWAMRLFASGGRLRAALVLAMVAGMVYYGGSKKITYPYTDAEQKYLTDDGSYVTNDFIHVSFKRIVAPDSASLYGSYRPASSTNDEDWVTFVDTTFAAFTVPQDIPFPAATNYDFVFYTTWTPGPSVQTNSVWHTYWRLDRKYMRHYIPVRTTIREDGVKIAPPEKE